MLRHAHSLIVILKRFCIHQVYVEAFDRKLSMYRCLTWLGVWHGFWLGMGTAFEVLLVWRFARHCHHHSPLLLWRVTWLLNSTNGGVERVFGNSTENPNNIDSVHVDRIVLEGDTIIFESIVGNTIGIVRRLQAAHPLRSTWRAFIYFGPCIKIKTKQNEDMGLQLQMVPTS